MPDGAAASDTSRLVGRMYGHCATPQPITMLATAPMASRRAHVLGVAEQQHERCGAADGGEDDERQRPGGQPVEHVAGVGPQDEDADERDHAGDDGGADGPAAEVLHHRLIAEPAGVPHEVDGGEVGDDDDGEHAAEHRRRVDPAVHGSPASPPAGTRPEAMAPATAPEAVRDEHRGEGEGGAEVAAVTGAEDGLAEGEARSPQHDPERGQGRAGRTGSG